MIAEGVMLYFAGQIDDVRLPGCSTRADYPLTGTTIRNLPVPN